MGKKYVNTIELTDGFKYSAKKPLDDRDVIDTLQSLMALSNDIIYEGMRISVVDDDIVMNNGVYKYMKTEKSPDSPIWTKVSSSVTELFEEDFVSLDGGSSIPRDK